MSLDAGKMNKSQSAIYPFMQSQRAFQALIEHSVDAIALVDIQGEVLYISPSIQRLLDYTPEELVGRICFDFVHPHDLESTLATLGGVIQEPEKSLTTEFRLQHKNGSWRWFEGTATNLLHDPDVGTVVGNFHDITERKETEARLRSSEARFRRLFEADIIGTFLSDFDGTFLEANDALLNIIGYSREELLQGKVQRDVLTPPEYSEVSRQAIKNLQTTGSTKPYEKMYWHKNGTKIPVLIAVARIDETSDICVGFVLDMREPKELERRKDEFIVMASHELKTPVTSLKGFTQLLQRRFKKRDDEESLRFLARMDGQLTKLTKLINDLLDISKMQSGQLVYREETFDLDALVQEIVENVQESAHSHTLMLECHAHVPIFADRDRIGQVLINLLTNAVKYSPQADKVLIRVSAEQENVCVSVQDFGLGIAEDQQQKIFERFYRVSDPTEQTFPGLGIGLYISNEIIKRHHGQMWVESTKGQGATFSFSLPLREKKENYPSQSML